jgi:hypothetical protein
LAGSSVVTLSNVTAFANTPISASSHLGTFGSIYVPASLVDAYKSATNWVTYAARITAIPDDSSLISFTIEGATYQAEEGMTWGEWINSAYNIDGYIAKDDLVQATIGAYVHDGNRSETLTEYIVPDYNYIWI